MGWLEDIHLHVEQLLLHCNLEAMTKNTNYIELYNTIIKLYSINILMQKKKNGNI